jgi:hypothetical protein
MEWGRTFLSGSYPVPTFAATQLTFFGLLLSKWTPPCLVPPFLHALNKHWEFIDLTQEVSPNDAWCVTIMNHAA